MDDPIIVVDESATQAATETIAVEVAEILAPVVEAAVEDAAGEDDEKWLGELLDEKLSAHRELLLTDLRLVVAEYRMVLTSLSEIVQTQSAALALASSSQASQSQASTQTPAESEAAIVEVIPTAEPASAEVAPQEARIETAKTARKFRKI